MTKEEWESKQKFLKKTYQYLPTGDNGKVEEKEFDPKEYETKLTPEEEVKFQKWLDTYHKQGKIGTGDYNFYKKNGYGYDYDFRAAFKEGTTPQFNREDKNWHWGDIGKKPNEPTFSNESKYYPKLATPGVGGYWNKEDEYVKNPVIGAPIPPKKEVLKYK